MNWPFPPQACHMKAVFTARGVTWQATLYDRYDAVGVGCTQTSAIVDLLGKLGAV